MRSRAGELAEAFRQRWKLIRLVAGVAPRHAAVLAPAIAARAVMPLAESIANGIAVGAVPAAVRYGAGSAAADRLLGAILVSVALFACGQVSWPLIDGLAQSAGRRVDRAIQQRAIAASLGPTGIDHLEDRSFADELSIVRGSRGGDFTPGGGVPALAVRLAHAGVGLGAAIMLGRFDVLLGLAVLVATAGMRWAFITDFLRQARALSGRAESMRRSSYLRDLALTPPAAKEVRVFGLAGWLLERFSNTWRDGMQDVWTQRKQGKRSIAGVIVFVGAVHVVGLLAIGRAGLRGELSLEEVSVLTGVLFSSMTLSMSGSDLHLAYGLAAIPALERAEEHARRRRRERPRGSSPAAGLPREAITFRGVTFTYPGVDVPVLDRLDLRIEAGRSLAIVGENGAGKTTLIKLLTAMYAPTSGAIAVDGIALEDLDAEDWRRRLGVVFQDFVRYELTARENVAFGAPFAPADDDALRRAAARAGALNVIEALPEGWDTTLSRRFEEGTDLSGGQWQRVALARAMYAVEQGAGLLILDEPTANLDARAEAEIYSRFIEMTSGLTTIVISHRFSTVRRADRIAVIEGGRVVELGSHDELMDLDGRYAHMFRLQAARFDASEEVGA